MGITVSKFLSGLLGDSKGYLKIAAGNKEQHKWYPQLIEYPAELKKAELQFKIWIKQGLNTYFSPHLFSRAGGKKEFALSSFILSADLDDCNPDNLGKYGEPKPNIVLGACPSNSLS